MVLFPDAVAMDVAWSLDPFTRPEEADWTRVDDADGLKNAVRHLTTKRGLDVKLNTVEPGSARAAVSNRNGWLTPGNDASPYAPNVIPRRRVRFRMLPRERGVAERTLATVFAERWPIAWQFSDGQTNFEGSDLLSLLAQETLPPSALQHEMVQSGPLAYWPMTEGSGTHVDDLVGIWDAILTEPISESVEVVPFDPRPLIDYRRPDDEFSTGQRAITAPVSLSTGTMTVCAWIRQTGDWMNNTILHIIPEDPASGNHGISFGTAEISGEPVAYIVANSAPGFDQITTETLPGGFDERPHFIAWTIDTSTDQVGFWWDGQPIVIGDSSLDDDVGDINFAALVPTLHSIAMGWGAFSGTGITNSTGAVGHVGLWERVLTGAEIMDLYQAGTNPFDGDSTGQRLDRVLDIVGVDPDDRVVAAGKTSCGPARYESANVLEYIRRIAVTERCPIWVDAEGRINFPGELPNDPDLDVTFDGTAADGAVPYEDVDPDYSIDRVQNVALVQREGGQILEKVNPISYAKYRTLNPAGGVIDTLHRSGAGARALAAQLVARGGEPQIVITSLDVNGRSEDVPHEVLWDLDITTPVRVRAHPPGQDLEQGSFVEALELNVDCRRGEISARFGVAEFVVLPLFAWDTAGQGWDESIWPPVE